MDFVTVVPLRVITKALIFATSDFFNAYFAAISSRLSGRASFPRILKGLFICHFILARRVTARQIATASPLRVGQYAEVRTAEDDAGRRTNRPADRGPRGVNDRRVIRRVFRLKAEAADLTVRYRGGCGVVVAFTAGFFGFQNAGSDARTSFGT